MKTHEVLVGTGDFGALKVGIKRAIVTYEFSEERFAVGDRVGLLEHYGRQATGKHVDLRVTSVARGCPGITCGFVVLSLQ